MRTKLKSFGVFSLAAIDLFASAMGAFIVITIVLMPDYQKEVRLEGHFRYIEELAEKAESQLTDREEGMQRRIEALRAEQALNAQMQSEREIVSGALASLQSLLADARRPPPPLPEPEAVVEPEPANLVTFRFLGLKTDKTRYLLMIDMNGYLGQYEELMEKTVRRALESLQPGMEFGLLAFQQLDAGPRFLRWPEGGGLAAVNGRNRAAALDFTHGLSGQYGGSSPLAAAFEQAFASEAGAIVLISDGLPNPAFNKNLPPAALVRDITLDNTAGKEIHAVTIGDYFKYRGTVQFMESLARANSGGFLALAQ